MTNQNEMWLPFPVNEKYHVSNLGRVKSFRKNLDGEICNQTISNLGYKKVSIVHDHIPLYTKNRFKHYYSHVIVAMTFIENPNGYPEVNHLDRDKLNNAVGNLEWCTHKQNIAHSYITRRMPKGKDHWLYGTKSSAETKKLQSEAKIGAKHPRFKGWYVQAVSVGQERIVREYESALQASKKTGFNHKSIWRWSHANKKGWSFKPVEVNTKEVEFEITNLTDIKEDGGIFSQMVSGGEKKDFTLTEIKQAFEDIALAHQNKVDNNIVNKARSVLPSISIINSVTAWDKLKDEELFNIPKPSVKPNPSYGIPISGDERKPDYISRYSVMHNLPTPNSSHSIDGHADGPSRYRPESSFGSRAQEIYNANKNKVSDNIADAKSLGSYMEKGNENTSTPNPADTNAVEKDLKKQIQEENKAREVSSYTVTSANIPNENIEKICKIMDDYNNHVKSAPNPPKPDDDENNELVEDLFKN